MVWCHGGPGSRLEPAVAGPEAAAVDARQAEAIREALEWIRKHPA